MERGRLREREKKNGGIKNKRWTEGMDRGKKRGQRRMTTSTCPNLLLSLRALLSPCNGQSWWCPVRERERGGGREREGPCDSQRG